MLMPIVYWTDDRRRPILSVRAVTRGLFNGEKYDGAL